MTNILIVYCCLSIAHSRASGNSVAENQSSFGFDADGLHQVGPHRELAVDDGGVLLGRGGLWLGAFDGKAFAHLAGRERSVECPVERVDDGARRTRWRGQAPSQRHVIAGKSSL